MGFDSEKPESQGVRGGRRDHRGDGDSERTGAAREVVDESAMMVLVRLEKRGSPGLVARVVDAYRSTAQDLVGSLQDAIRGDRRESIERIAHTLRGSSQQVGATVVVHHCRVLEATAWNADTEALSALSALLKEEVDTAADRLDVLASALQVGEAE